MNCVFKLIAIIVGGLLMAAEGRAATLFHVDDFELGTVEGWAGAAPTNQSSGGPLGADDNFLQLVSTGFGGPGSKMATNNASFDLTGDYAAAGVEVVTVDMMVPISSPSLDMRLVLIEPSGPTMTNNRWTSTNEMPVPNDGVWRNYSFSVAEADLTFVPLLPSVATYNDLINNVVRVLLRHDPGTPSSEGVEFAATLGVDNVTLDKLFTPGDFDMDEDVDGNDFLKWQVGQSPNPFTASDLAVWEANFGTPAPLSATATDVPEPSTWILLAIGMAVLLFPRQVVVPQS